MALAAELNSLLVPLDGTPYAEQAIPWALVLSMPTATIVLLRVLPPTGAAEELLGRRSGADAAAAAAAARAGLATTATAWPREAGFELAVGTGDPAEVIVNEAARRGVGAVVIASHGRGAVGRWMFGSVADRVARTSTIPVVIVRRDDDAPSAATLRRVVVPLDGSPRSLEALPAAGAIASGHGLPIHLVTALDVSGLTPVAAPGMAMPVSGELYTQVYNDLEAGARAALAEAADTLASAGAAVTTEVRVGSPYSVIVDILRPGDIVVITSHGRTGVRRWLLGSVAEQLVRFAPAPVMLVPSPERAAVAAAV
jgi:nucleotide-binding universal stress UspA family protein